MGLNPECKLYEALPLIQSYFILIFAFCKVFWLKIQFFNFCVDGILKVWIFFHKISSLPLHWCEAADDVKYFDVAAVAWWEVDKDVWVGVFVWVGGYQFQAVFGGV